MTGGLVQQVLSGRHSLDDVIHGCVGIGISGFQFAVRPGVAVGLVIEVGAEDVAPVLDRPQRGVEFLLQLFGDADAEDLADHLRGQTTQLNLAGAFEDAVDGEMALAAEIAAVLDLVDGVEPVGFVSPRSRSLAKRRIVDGQERIWAWSNERQGIAYSMRRNNGRT